MISRGEKYSRTRRAKFLLAFCGSISRATSILFSLLRARHRSDTFRPTSSRAAAGQSLLVDGQPDLSIEPLRPGVQWHRKIIERVLEPDFLPERTMSVEQTPRRVVPQRLGDFIDQLVSGIGRYDPQRPEADRWRLSVDPRIDAGRDHRPAE